MKAAASFRKEQWVRGSGEVDCGLREAHTAILVQFFFFQMLWQGNGPATIHRRIKGA